MLETFLKIDCELLLDVVLHGREQSPQLVDDPVQFADRVSRYFAKSAHVARFQLFDRNIDKRQIGKHGLGSSDPGWLGLHLLPRDGSHKLATGELSVIDSQVDSTTGQVRLRATFTNDPKAMTMLGELYANAMGVRRDYAKAALAHGIAGDHIMLDVGIGFGKKFDQNYPLLAGLGQLQDLGFPLLVGTSRKSFIGRTLAVDGKDAPPDQRLYGSLAAATASVLNGAHVVRVHDVKPAVEAVKIADEVLRFAK